MNPLGSPLVWYCFFVTNQWYIGSPLRSDVHDQDDLSFKLLKVVFLSAGEFGFEVVEIGHRSGGVWGENGKQAVGAGVKMGE